MNKSLLAAVCNYDRDVFSNTRSGSTNAIADSCSVVSYLEAPKGHNSPRRFAETPAEVRRVACSLFAMGRSERRNYLSRISDSQRRLLLNEGKRIRARITDAAVDYAPQVCWAIENVMDGGTDGAPILDGLNTDGSLPREVADWYRSLKLLGGNATETRSLAKRLGKYRLGSTPAVRHIQDDDALDRFLAASREEEGALENAVDESIMAAADLTEKAQERIAETKKELQDQANDFIGSMVESVTAIIPDIVAEQAAGKADEAAEDIVKKADEDLDAEQAANEEAQDEIDTAEDVFGLDKEGRPLGDSMSVQVNGDGKVTIQTKTTSVEGDGSRVSATIEEPTEQIDFTEEISEETFDTLEDHLTDSQRAVLDSLASEAPGEAVRAVSIFRDWLKENYAAIKEDPDSIRERLEALMNALNTILGPLNIMLSVDNTSLIYNGTEALVTFSEDGMEIGSLMYSFNNNPTATDTLLRNASDEFGIIVRSLEPSATDNGPAANSEEGNDAGEVTDAADDKLYDTIMANIDTLVGQLDEMGAPAKKAEKYMRPWFDRLSKEELAELQEAVNALPKDHVSDADDGSILSDEAKQEVLNKVNEEVKRRLKESGIEIADDANGKEWMDYWGEGADVAANLRKARTILSDDEWKATLKAYNETADAMGLPKFTGEDSVDDVLAAGVPELVFATIQNVLSDDELIRFMDLIDDDSVESEEDIEVEGEAEDIEDGLLDMGKKAINKARIKIGDKLQIGDKWATVVKKKLKTFMVKFQNGTYKEYKYPNKLVSVPDQDNAGVMETEDSAPKVKDKMDPNEDGDKNVSIGWDREELNKRLRAIAEKRKDATITEIDDAMTLEEAIEHAEEVAATCDGEECREEHAQLAQWLSELKALKDASALPTVHPDVHEGDRNTYDMNHNLETFTKVRNTREALDEILRIVTKTMGLAEPVTVDQYQNGEVDERVSIAVSDSTFDMNELDLICPKLYKRKFTDSEWMVDSIDDIEGVFGITIPDSFKGMPAIVSARPIEDSIVAGLGSDKTIAFPYNDKQSLYVVPFSEQ